MQLCGRAWQTSYLACTRPRKNHSKGKTADSWLKGAETSKSQGIEVRGNLSGHKGRVSNSVYSQGSERRYDQGRRSPLEGNDQHLNLPWLTTMPEQKCLEQPSAAGGARWQQRKMGSAARCRGVPAFVEPLTSPPPQVSRGSP